MNSFDEFVKNLVKDAESINPELAKMLERLADKVKDHEFDEGSEMCKDCKSFTKCKFNNQMIAKIKSANINDSAKETLIDFVDWIQHEDSLASVFNINCIIKDKDFKLYNLINRFKECDEHLDILVAILDESELKYIRSIIHKVNKHIENLFETITDINRIEMNNLVNKLHKPQQEAKRYEDMTREELLEELKKK